LISSSKNGAQASEKNTLLPSNYLMVFEKVWQEAERIFDDMRSALFKQLARHSQSMAVQEQIIRYDVACFNGKSASKFAVLQRCCYIFFRT
jgi:hypothetical protein